MKKRLISIFAVLVVLAAYAATIVTKVSDFPIVTTPGTNDFFLLAVTNAPPTNNIIRYSSLKSAINAGVASAGTTNTVINSTTINSTTINNTTNIFNVSKGGHLVVTNDIQMPWTTLTLSGTTVSTIDASAGSFYKLTLTTNAFFGAPSNLPGTNFAQTIQIALLQDGTGARTVTMTNSAWLMNGAGSTTNAVPTINTNANGITVLTFVTSPFSATQLLGVPTTIAP